MSFKNRLEALETTVTAKIPNNDIDIVRVIINPGSSDITEVLRRGKNVQYISVSEVELAEL